MKLRASLMQISRLNGCLSRSIFSLSIREKSRISFIMERRDSPLFLMVIRYSLCSGLRSVPKIRLVIPMTTFMGVLISWLILARNSDLAFAAASASSLALLRSSSIRFLAVISRAVPTTASRDSYVVKDPNTCTSTMLPLLVMPLTS